MERAYIKLPIELSCLVGETVKKYADKHELESYLWYHDADLWMLFKEENLKDRVGMIKRKVSIGGFYDQRPELAFLPEVLLFSKRNYLSASDEQRKIWFSDPALAKPIDVLLRQLYRSRLKTQREIEKLVNLAWIKTESIAADIV